MAKNFTLAALYRHVRKALEGLDGNLDLEARLICEKAATSVELSAGFLTWDTVAVTESMAAAADAMVQRRQAHEPLAYILEEWEFWGMAFSLGAHTLIPRPDTETLVAAVLHRTKDQSARLLDLGVGSGCIGLALLAERRQWQLVGLDTSREALLLAQENAARHKLETRAAFLESHWYENLPVEFEADVIVSNPPYIPSADIAALDKTVRDYEPVTALDGGADGLSAYREIIGGAPGRLRRAGLLALEIGIGQLQDVTGLMKAHGFRDIEDTKDLAGISRVLTGFLS